MKKSEKLIFFEKIWKIEFFRKKTPEKLDYLKKGKKSEKLIFFEKFKKSGKIIFFKDLKIEKKKLKESII